MSQEESGNNKYLMQGINQIIDFNLLNQAPFIDDFFSYLINHAFFLHIHIRLVRSVIVSSTHN